MTEAPLPFGDELIPLNDITRYLRRGLYDSGGVYSSNETLVDEILPSQREIIIGVDGPSTGGKTSITEALKEYYAAKDVPVAVLPVDFFLTDRSVRTELTKAIADGKLDIADYSLEAWEHERYHNLLVHAKEIVRRPSGAETIILPRAYNRVTGQQDHVEEVKVIPGGVLIAEGTGIHAFHDEMLDFKVRVDVQSDKILLDRVVARELKKPEDKRLDPGFVTARYRTTDIPHTNYLRLASAGRADVVIDTTNTSAMRMYRKIKVQHR